MTKQVLAGDIGGTNTRLVFSDNSKQGQNIIFEKNYPSADYSGLLDVIDKFLLDFLIDTPVDAACFAVAGPVEFGAASITNLPWQISEETLKSHLQIDRVKLINDFVAAAYGVSDLQTSDMLLIQEGVKQNEPPIKQDAVVMGAGTGFGAAHLVWLKQHWHVHPSEAGHVGFSPATTLQIELLAWMQKKHTHVCLEMLLSGKGLVSIYHFLHERDDYPESLFVNRAMHNKDPAEVITEYALLENDDLCQKTLDLFIDIYGAASSDVALHYYPVSELYIAGGIAPKLKDQIMSRRFIDAFLNKGLMTENIKKSPSS